MIQVSGLVKRYGARVAVDQLTFEVHPGRVTGFLGPNGSGKSTTMRCMIGLDRADEGSATFGGKPFRALEQPLREVGVLLDAGYVHPTRQARLHLAAIAASNGIARSRVGEVLDMVGLGSVGELRPGAYSLGMRQRLGLAAAMLGDPQVLILDEPANGLDPEGIRWIRDFLAYLARQGRSVFVSSHLLSEMALMADHVVVIGQGRLVDQGAVADFVQRYTDQFVRVRTPSPVQLAEQMRAHGATVAQRDDLLEVRGAGAVEIGELAARLGVVLHELSPVTGSLEDAYLRLTGGAAEYRGNSAPPPSSAALSAAPTPSSPLSPPPARPGEGGTPASILPPPVPPSPGTGGR